MGDLWICIASESDTAMNPSDLCELPCKIICHKPCVVRLVEVYIIPFGKYLVKLLMCIVACCEEIIIHQYNVLSSVCNLINIPIGSNSTFFSWDDAPKAFVRTSSCQESIRRAVRDLRVYGKIGLAVVYNFRKFGGNVITSSTFDNFIGVNIFIVSWCKIENF